MSGNRKKSASLEKRERRKKQSLRKRKYELEQRLQNGIRFNEGDIEQLLQRNQPLQPVPFRKPSIPNEVRLFEAFGFLIGLITYLLWRETASQFAQLLLTLIIFLLAISAVAYVLYFIWINRVLLVRIRPDSIETIEGIVIRTEVPGWSLFGNVPPVQLDVNIGDMRFHVSQSVYDAFESGVPYRLYYSTGSRHILAAEVLLPDGE